MIPPMPHDLPEPQLKPNTEVVLQKRYLHKKSRWQHRDAP